MKKLLAILIIAMLIPSTCSAASTTTKSQSTRASTVFDSVCSAVAPSGYSGDCTLVRKGSGNIEVILQFLNPVYSGWQTYKGNISTESFSNELVAAAGDSLTLPAGKYRTKTMVTATVNGVTESRTVYSPELTLY